MLIKIVPSKIKYLLVLILGIALGYFSPKKPKIVTKIITHTKVVREQVKETKQKSSQSKARVEKKIVTVRETYCPNGKIKSQTTTQEFIGSQVFNSSNLDSVLTKNSLQESSNMSVTKTEHQPNWLVSFEVPKDYQNFKDYQAGFGYRIFSQVDFTAKANLGLKQFYFGGQVHF